MKHCENHHSRLTNFIYELLLLLLKPAAQTQVGKSKLLINCFRNHTSTCTPENCRKHNSWKQPNGWRHPWAHPAFWCQTQCIEGHSTFKPGAAGNTLQIGMFYTWILTWILGVVSKQLILLSGRVGGSTTFLNSLSPQMS